MSAVDPINYAATLLSRSEHISIEDGPSVLPVSNLGRRHSIAVPNDLEAFSQSLQRDSFSTDQEKSFELQSSVCDTSRKRRTSFCCPVEPGTKAPPRKRRLSICENDNSVQEQLIHNSNGSVSYSVPYQEQGPSEEYLSYRRGSLPNYSPQIPSSLSNYSFGPNSPFTIGCGMNTTDRRQRQYRAKPQQRRQSISQQQFYAGYPPAAPPVPPPLPPLQQDNQSWDYFQETSPAEYREMPHGQFNQNQPYQQNQQQFYQQTSSPSDQFQQSPSPPQQNQQNQQNQQIQQIQQNQQNQQYQQQNFNCIQNYQGEYNTPNNDEFTSSNEFPRSTSPDQLFGSQTFPELPSAEPNQSPFSDIFNSEPPAFSADSFVEKPATLNNFPLARSNLNYLQNPLDDLNANVDVHENKSAKEKEDKKKGLKWTNVTASITMKYANDPKYNRNGQTSANTPPVIPDNKEAVKRMVNRWKCTKYTV